MLGVARPRTLNLVPWLLQARLRSWIVHGTMLVVLLCGLLSAGTAFAFCPHAKKTRRVDTCCAKRHARLRVEAELRVPTDADATVRRQGCCEAFSLDALPVGEAADPPQPPNAIGPLVAVVTPALGPLGPAPSSWEPAPTAPGKTAVPIRAGPQSALERCAWLQVFLR